MLRNEILKLLCPFSTEGTESEDVKLNKCKKMFVSSQKRDQWTQFLSFFCSFFLSVCQRFMMFEQLIFQPVKTSCML